jgi:hypothetical protein
VAQAEGHLHLAEASWFESLHIDAAAWHQLPGPASKAVCTAWQRRLLGELASGQLPGRMRYRGSSEILRRERW